MLLKFDEYPYHQITETFAGVQGSDPQWNDGHYVCFADLGGRVSMTSNVRLYQNNDVLDGFVCIRHEGRQHNIRLSRRLRTDMNHFGVGPLRIEIVEPMETLRFVLEENEHGIACDIVCQSTVVPYMAPIEITRIDGRLMSERATYEITGRCEGTVEVAGQRYELGQDTAMFFRNHSWGYQGGRGGPRIYGAPTKVGDRRNRPLGLRNWVLYNVGSHGGFFHTFDAPGGRRTSSRGAILTADSSVPIESIDHHLEFYEGGRRVRRGTFDVTDREGVQRSYSVEDLGWVYCQGGGYFGGFDDGLGQGVYRGEYHVEGEVWDVSHPTKVVSADGREFEFDHAWAENFMVVRTGDDVGLTHFECVVFD